jgi:hypothetical protein
MGSDQQANPDKSDDCDVSKSSSLQEHKDKLKTCVDTKIKRFSEDVFGSLKEAGASQIIEYLIKAGIEYIDDLYKAKPEEAKPLIKDIWINYYPYVESRLLENKFGRENIILTIRSVLSDRERGNLFESLLIFADVMAKMEKYFKSNEAILYQLRYELSNLHNRGLFQRTVINLPSEGLNAAPFSRGDLKIEVEVSKPLIVAGERFSLFVTITNPFEVPVVIYSVETMIPAELEEISEVGTLPKERNRGVAKGFATIDLEFLKEGLSPPPYLLQPDDRICKQLVLRTRGNSNIFDYKNKKYLDTLKWLNFTPERLLLEIQIKYGVDYREHLDSVKTEVDIQVGLKAIMVGAILGGLFGGFVRAISKSKFHGQWNLDDVSVYLCDAVLYFGNIVEYVVIAIVFSAIAVVAFARKTGVQKIVSIEDFYGGLLIGFIVGYQGPEYFWGQVMRVGNNTTSI